MVTTLNITVDDTVADDARAVKDDLDLTWPEFIEYAAKELQQDSTPGNAGREPHTQRPENTGAAAGIRENVPGTGEIQDRRVAALESMRSYLQEHGAAPKSDLVALVDPDKVGYQSADSFWKNVVIGNDTLRDYPDVSPPPEGGNTWRFTG